MALLCLILFFFQVPYPGPPIHHVPRLVDSTFNHRITLCPAATSTPGELRHNDARVTVAELFGNVSSVDVHQVGDSFAEFSAVRRYLAELLARRPQTSYPSVPWAEGTPLAAWGVLATVHFKGEADAHLEATGSHLCLQHASGAATWWRLEPMDVWNEH
jgi:hypothetical protein